MKKLILFLCIIFIIKGYSQYSFQTIIDSDKDQRSYQILVLEDGYFIVSTFLLEDLSMGVVYKLDQYGGVVDSLIFDNGSDRSSMFNSSIILENGEIRVFGTLEKPDMPGFYELCWLDIDSDLNIIQQHYFDAGTGRGWRKIYPLIRENGNISIASIVDGSPPSESQYKWDKFIIEMTQNGEVVFDSIYNQTNFETIMDLYRSPN